APSMGLPGDGGAAVCQEAAGAEVVSPANLNGGGQVVIAGHKDAVDRACAAAKSRGAKRAIPLAVSAPFHCELTQPAAERLAAGLGSVEAQANQYAARVKDLLARQVTAPVRWEESVQCMVGLGVDSVIEVGAGN